MYGLQIPPLFYRTSSAFWVEAQKGEQQKDLRSNTYVIRLNIGYGNDLKKWPRKKGDFERVKEREKRKKKVKARARRK